MKGTQESKDNDRKTKKEKAIKGTQRMNDREWKDNERKT